MGKVTHGSKFDIGNPTCGTGSPYKLYMHDKAQKMTRRIAFRSLEKSHNF